MITNETMKSQWDKSVRFSAAYNWPKLTIANLDTINGDVSTLYSQIVTAYSVTLPQAMRQVKTWFAAASP